MLSTMATRTVRTVTNQRFSTVIRKRLLTTTSTTTQNYQTTTTRNSSSSSSSSPSDRLLVVGSGVAGSAVALVAAEKYRIPVSLLYAGSVPTDCNSYWAQGGIIYRNYNPESGDSAESLVNDIFRAGAGLSEAEAAWKLAMDGPDRVRELLLSSEDNSPYSNVPFDRDSEGNLSCCLEASHAAPRIIHYADHTGQVITQHITAAAQRHPLITLVPDTLVTDLVVQDDMCVGVETFNQRTSEMSNMYASHGTVLASGGLANIYEHSTNPSGFNALGSSVGLAMRTSERAASRRRRQQQHQQEAVVATKDLEYVQFHPTSLFIPNESRFLLTEALRGEGALLRDADGRAFAKDFHPQGELAPRDIVARGVYNESQKTSTENGEQHNAYLDITHREQQWLYNRYPKIQQHLLSKGLDLASDMIPIIPAAHYTCGGIESNLNGCTTLPNLYVAGEAARTGLHGGNRLASTSLLEALVFGASVADYCGKGEGRDVQSNARITMDNNNNIRNNSSKRRNTNTLINGEAELVRKGAMELLHSLRKTMWEYVGVVRTAGKLETAIDTLADIKEESIDLYTKHKSIETIGLRDAVYAGNGVAQAAYANRTSAGAHYIVSDDNDADADSSSDIDSDSDDDDIVMSAQM